MKVQLQTAFSTSSHINLGNSGLPLPAAKVKTATSMQTVLFGSMIPKPVDPRQFPELVKLLKKLRAKKSQLAYLQGDSDSDYELGLMADRPACIDSQGRIFLGVQFLRDHEDEEETLVGALAHEIGHRPKQWQQQYETLNLTPSISLEDRQALSRLEERKADTFAGKALANLGLKPAGICRFLLGETSGSHPAYDNPGERVATIKLAYANAAYRQNAAAALFPEYFVATNAGGFIADAA